MRIGFIGLGIMGMPMAQHLVDAGHSLIVYNKTRAKAELLGQRVVDSPADVARYTDLIFMIISDTAGVEAMAEGLLEGIRPGSVVVDCTTISPSVSRGLAAQFAERCRPLAG